jgi:hypothetical protein
VKEVKEKRERFEQKIKKEGLSYQGSDAIECGCGNKFAPEGRLEDFARSVKTTLKRNALSV